LLTMILALWVGSPAFADDEASTPTGTESTPPVDSEPPADADESAEDGDADDSEETD